MATMFEIRALLEDGPVFPAQLAEWLEMELPPLLLLLKQMQIPACDRCERRFIPRARNTARFCSSECDWSETITDGGTVTPDRRGEKDMATRSTSSAQRRDDPEFDIVWNGVGPLPGTGAAAGLGSTLSGSHFLKKRG
jgi:hypothetical protein